jgi:2-oxoglutarate ferredoxin oxidoreductase subunit delta
MAKKGKPVIDRERCKGCYLCVRACPVKVLEPDTKSNSGGVYPSFAKYTEKCIACGGCYLVCPDAAIEVFELEGGES